MREAGAQTSLRRALYARKDRRQGREGNSLENMALETGWGGAPSAPVQQEMVGDRAAAPGAGREGLRAGRAMKSATRAAVGGALKRNPSLQPGHIEERKFKRKKLGKDDSELALNTFMFNEMFPLDGD